MTSIRFEHGLKEIGGTFLVIETAQAKCMFDFGYARAHLIDQRLSYRRDDRAHDLVKLGILPAENGIYDDACARRLGLAPYDRAGEEKTSFFVISHMHIDHMGALDCLHPELPVYMSEDSLTLYRSLAACKELDGEMHPATYAISEDQPLTIGDLTVRAVAVDHDVIGATGYLFETPDGRIAYTGDFRMHGFHPEVTKAFAKTCAGVDVLLCEGTMVSFDLEPDAFLPQNPPRRTEEDLLADLLREAKETDRLLVCSLYPRNVERVLRIHETLRQANRRLVLDERSAHHVLSFYPEAELFVYEETMTEAKSHLSAGTRYVTLADLHAHPGDYLLHLPYRDIFALCDVCDITAAYLHCDGTPLGAYDPSYQVLLDRLAQLNLPYRLLSVGGHAEPYWLRWMVESIAPKVCVPIHSFRPEQLTFRDDIQRILPEEGFVLHLPVTGE